MYLKPAHNWLRAPVWIVACAVGDGLGALASSVFGSTIHEELAPETLGSNPWLARLLLGAAGALEGLVLGIAQGVAIRFLEPRVPTWWWIGATTASMSVGWFLAAWIGGDPGPSPTMEEELALGAASGLSLGAVVGTGQALVRRRPDQRLEWILVNALGWTAGMILSFVGMRQLDGTSRLELHAMVFVTGLGVGGLVGIVTAVPQQRTPAHS